MTFGNEAHEWLCRATGIPQSRLQTARMPGSTSSSLFLICDASEPDTRFVLRVLENAAWLLEEPDLARHEAAALHEAQRTGVPAPRLIDFVDEAGFGAPVVLMSHLEGEVELCPRDLAAWIEQLAQTLARIHAHPAESFGWRYGSWVNRDALAVPSWTEKPQLWERAIEVALGGEPDEPAAFLHRDFHPANVLWEDGQISGVVDWINACRGPRGVDVAHCRTNLVQMFGPDAADAFLRDYATRVGGYEHHPFWDVSSLLDMALPEPEFYAPWREFGLPEIAPETLRRRTEEGLERALRQL